MTPDLWKELFNYGVPTALICFIGFAVWRVIKFMGKAMFDESHGVVVRYVAKHEEFLSGLSIRDEKQQQLCAAHAQLLGNLNTLMNDRTPVLQATADGIRRLVELSETRNSPISTVSLTRAIPALKSAALEHCEMCKKIIKHQLPTVAEEACRHLDEMVRIVEGIEE